MAIMTSRLVGALLTLVGGAMAIRCAFLGPQWPGLVAGVIAFVIGISLRPRKRQTGRPGTAVELLRSRSSSPP